MTYVKTTRSNCPSNYTATWSACSDCCRWTSSYGWLTISSMVIVFGSNPPDYGYHRIHSLLWTLELEELGLDMDHSCQLDNHHNINL